MLSQSKNLFEEKMETWKPYLRLQVGIKTFSNQSMKKTN